MRKLILTTFVTAAVSQVVPELMKNAELKLWVSALLGAAVGAAVGEKIGETIFKETEAH